MGLDVQHGGEVMDTKGFLKAWREICSTFYSEHEECSFCPIQSNCYAGRMDDQMPEEYIGDTAALIDTVERYSNE